MATGIKHMSTPMSTGDISSPDKMSTDNGELVWVGFIDVLPVIGSVKEAVEFVLAVAGGDHPLINEKERMMKARLGLEEKTDSQSSTESSSGYCSGEERADVHAEEVLLSDLPGVIEAGKHGKGKQSGKESQEPPSEEDQKKMEAIREETLQKIQLIDQNYQFQEPLIDTRKRFVTSYLDNPNVYIDAIGQPRGIPEKYKEALASLGEQLQATSLMTWQNRMALDWLLAEKGGQCVLFGDQCCVLLSDLPGVIETGKHGKRKQSGKESQEPPSEEDQKKMEAIQEETLQTIQLIDQNYQFQEPLIDTGKRSQRGEHVINNNVIKFHFKLVEDYLTSRSSQTSLDVSCPLPENTKRDIMCKMVAHFETSELYINANAVVYGKYMSELKNALLQFLQDGGQESKNRASFVIQRMNQCSAYVDFMAKEKWMQNSCMKRCWFEAVRREVAEMFADKRGVEFFAELRKDILSPTDNV